MLPVVAKPRILTYGSSSGTGDFYQSLDKRTAQKAPFNVPTANTADRRLVTSHASIGGYATIPSFAEANTNVYYADNVLLAFNNNRAYSRLISNLHDEAMLAVNFFEREQAAKLFTKRAMQLVRFARNLRRGNIFAAEDSIGYRKQAMALRAKRSLGQRTGANGQRLPDLPPANQKRWSKSHSLADAWLEYHFGLDPLMKDLEATFNVFTDLPPLGKIRGSSRTRGSIAITQNLSSTVHVYTEYEYNYRHATGCNISVPDRDAYLANRLGLVNPYAWVWELTPWSFVADWVVNVGDYINSMTDLHGVRVTNPWSSYSQKQTGYQRRYTSSGPQVGYMTYRTDSWFSRSTSLLNVKLAVRPLKRVSLVRAVTAISLLVGFLPR